MIEYKFRNITPEDYEYIYELKKNAYKEYVIMNWGAWDEEAQKEYFKNFIDTYKDTTYIIQTEGKDIGFYNDAMLENGNYEIGNICIIPEYQGKGVNAMIINDLLPRYIEIGVVDIESNPELEMNDKIQSQWDNFEKEQHKRRRAYKKAL